MLPRAHGSGLFTRGQTQALSVLTLGALGDYQLIDGLGPEVEKRFMHHYNFPNFSVGETGLYVHLVDVRLGMVRLVKEHYVTLYLILKISLIQFVL